MKPLENAVEEGGFKGGRNGGMCHIFKRPTGLQREHDCIREVRHGVGHVLKGLESTQGELCSLRIGAGMALANCVFLAWKMT